MIKRLIKILSLIVVVIFIFPLAVITAFDFIITGRDLSEKYLEYLGK